MNTYIKMVFSLIICLGCSFISYTQDCGPQSGGESVLEGGKVIISYGASTNSVSPKVASSILLGQAVIGQNNTTQIVAEYGFYSQFLLPPLPPTVTASQGELLDRIQVSWSLDPLGSAPNEGFNLYRDGVFIESVGSEVRNFNDFNVIAGRPYTYSISGINKFGEGSQGDGLGFQVPNGVVTGWVSTLNDRPVPGAQVTLLPMQGFSAKFGTQDGAVAIEEVDQPFLPAADEDWTMTFWMNTTDATANADVIRFDGSSLEIKALAGADGISVTEGSNNLTSNFTSNEWHHITLAYEGTANTGRLYIDGILASQSDMDNIVSPDSLYFGQVDGSNGWSGYLDEFRIYHTLLDQLDLGMVMDGTASSTTPFLNHYWKFDEELGEKSFDIINRKQLYFCGAQFDANRPPVRTAAVTNEEGYYLIEGVSYGTGTTFIAEPEKNFYLRRSLQFNRSEEDFVSIPDFALPEKTTIELWVNNTNAGPAQTMLSKKEGNNNFKIYSELQGGNNEIKIDINGTSQSFGNLLNGFNHLAFTMDSIAGQITGYINGGTPISQTYTIPSTWSDTTYNWYIGADSDGITNFDYFNGLIDEIAVYDTLLSAATILEHSQNARDMTEEGLPVYFPMDEGNGNRVNNVGSIFLDFGNVEGAAWSNFAANQETTPHIFTPKTRQVTLNPSVTSVDQVDFTDLSTIPVSGYVRFQGTDCFQPNVEILVNGTSFSPKVFTDDEGKFLVDFDPGFTGILTPKYVKIDSEGQEVTEIEAHTFSPASWELINITGPIAGVLFNNTVKRKISGQVTGGLCKLPILNAPGTDQGTICKVKVSTPDGCLERIYTFGVNEESGDFEFDNLPPVEQIVVSVIEHSNPSIKTYFEVSGGTQLDISLKDTIADMIYFAPPEVAITSGLDPYSQDCDIVVLDQGRSESITIKMQEIYLGQVCVIDTGAIYIINGLSDEEKDTTISNGSLVYEFIVGEPNPSPPYLKTLQIVGTSLGGRESSTTKQALITGLRNKENTFTSKLPNQPMLVLRDPPGDGSSAYFEKGETICQTTEFHLEDDSGVGFGGQIFLGGNVEIVAAPLGVGTIVNTGVIFNLGLDVNFTWNTVTDSSWQTCLTTNERIATSDDDLLIGRASDIFMGTATNIIFGFADVVSFDEDMCEGGSEVVLNIEADSDFASTYIYTRFQIENYLIPNLTLAAEQEVDSTLKAEYEGSVISWNEILAQSDSTVLETEYVDNISFSAGLEYESFMTSDSLLVTSAGSGNGESTGAGTNIGYQFNGLGFTVAASTFAGRETYDAVGDETSNFVTTGFIFSDDDPGDAFSVDIGLDSLYKTPVFSLKAGQSACPWEEGTANREAPNLEIVPNADGSSAFVATNVPANEPAVFQFVLGNLSATNEDWTYGFTSIAANNPNGAVVQLNGSTLNNSTIQYIVPFGTSIPITVTVEKGPIEYDYDDLLVALVSECELERNLALSIPLDADPKFFSDIKISARFIRPCSEVNINVPQQNWVLYNSINTPDIMNVTVSGYDLSEADFQLIRLQYRKENGDGAWINVPGISDRYNPNWKDYDAEPDVLGDIFTQYSWDTNGLSDGNYEIRAVAVCSGDASDKPGFSQTIKGRIDREAPVLLGVPQPSDGVFHVGDEISFTFNQDINCTKLIQADMTQANNVGLFDATTGDLIDATISCFDNKIIIDPNFQNEFFENKILRTELYNIEDLVGNNMVEEIWEFYVDRNELAWLTDSIKMTKYDDETKTIIAKIQNRGGYPVPYTMQDLPDWVHVSPNSGTLVANEIEEIHFTVDENVPLGYLSDSIILHTETGENPFFMGGDEILNMTARVICRPDAWIVNPDNFNASNFSFSMNYNLSLNIEGTLSEDIQDIVGAYVDGQLRGVSRVQYNPQLNNHLAFITVYSNIVSGETVDFQIWDASECKLFAPVVESFTFNANDIVGSPTNPQVLHTTGKVLRKIFVHPGWNWISMNLELEDASVNAALSSLSNPEDALIKGQTNFSSYSTGLESWFGDLDSVSYLDLYQYNSVNYDSISMVGTLVDPNTEIPLTSGWNWIGYIPNEKLPIAQALSSLTPSDGDLIKSQVSFAQYVDNIGWIGNLHFLDAPNGYLLKLSNPDILIYPDPQSLLGSTGMTTYTHSSILGGKGEKKESTTRSADHWEVDASLYENSMNVIGIVVKSEGDNILDDFDEVAAFVGNEVRGHAKTIYIPAIDSYMIFMTIYANQEGELLTFKFFDSSNNQEFDLEEKSGFVVNSVLGEVDDPKPLHIATSTSVSDLNGEEKMSIYPNPFSRTLTINFHSENTDEIEMSIKDVYGNTVENSIRKMSTGMNVLEWTPSANILQGSYIVTLKDSDSYYIKKVIYVK
jgi:hypothetical protein